MSSPTPNWYPDPSGQPLLRWWDGRQWTEHVQPPAAPAPAAGPAHSAPSAPARAPEQRRRSRKGLVIGLTAGALALVLIAVVAVAAVRLLGSLGATSLPTDARPVDGRDYLMTEPLRDVHHETTFSFPAPYDFDERFPSGLGEHATTPDGPRESDAFELFLDPSLTVRGSLSIFQSKPGDDIWVSPNESTDMLSASGGSIRVMPTAWRSGWGLESEYFLVRHIDENGEQLKAPVVTRLLPEARELASPKLRADRVAENGTVELTWNEVPGATEYIVIGSHNVTTDSRDYRRYFAYDKVTGTSWTSKDDVDEFEPDSRQNASMALFDGQSADQILGEGLMDEDAVVQYDTGEFRWSVIASDGADFSRLGSLDAAGVVGGLPYQVASYEMPSYSFRGPLDASRLPQRFAFTGLDGRTRVTQAYIPDDGVSVDAAGSWEIRIHGAGTMLVSTQYWALDVGQRGTDPAAFIAAYNAAAAAAYRPTTGLGAFEVLGGTLEEAELTSAQAKEPAEVPYPVYGSDEFVRFLAGHFIAGTELIDVSAYALAPGAQDLWDAINEAHYQNPYVVGLDRIGFRENRTTDRWVLRPAYSLDASERSRIQKSIAKSVDSVLASVVRDGMNDRQIATAVNDWLVAEVAYDYAAFESLPANGGQPDAAFDYAWRADGVFENKSVVCGGYAITYSALMNAAGVETVVVTGDVLSAGRHAWNKVRVDGEWLSVDTTWNDAPQGNRFLLIQDGAFAQNATRVEDSYWMRDDLVGSFATQ